MRSTPACQRRVLSDGTVALRPSRANVGSAFWPLLPLSVPVFFLTTHDRLDHSQDDLFRGMLAFFAIELAILLAVALRRAVLLGTETLVLRGPLHSVTLRASDIQAVTATGGALVNAVKVWTADGRSHTCPAVTGVDLEVIGEWWLAHRGDDWRAVWSRPAAVPRRIAWWA